MHSSCVLISIPVAWPLVNVKIRQWDAGRAQKFIHAQKVAVQRSEHHFCSVPMLRDLPEMTQMVKEKLIYIYIYI